MEKLYGPLKTYIEQNIELIEDNNFEELYSKLNHSYLSGQLTACFLKSGIYPDLYMSTIPAYYATNLDITTYDISPTVKDIGYWAFRGCDHLENVHIPQSVIHIEGYAFFQCSMLKDVLLPKNLVSIGEAAFDGCSELKSITIPSTVLEIGRWAFSNIDELSVTYGGTREQWKNLYKSNQFEHTYAVINCLDGSIVKKKIN